VTGTGAAYLTYSGWSNCASITYTSYSYILGCSFAEAVTNGVSGTVGVSNGVISDSVGFTVQYTRTVTAVSSFTIAAHSSGSIQYRQVYRVVPVHQNQYDCWAYTSNCWQVGSGTTYASQWQGTGFQKT